MGKRADLIKDLVKGDLKFFINTAPVEELKKSSWISTNSANQLVVHNVTLKENTDNETPTFILKSNEQYFTKYNYVYSFDLKRFYWINKTRLLTQGQIEIDCIEDYLYSWINEINNCMGFEDRSTNIGTGYIEDNEIIFNTSPIGDIFEFTNGVGSKAFKDQSYIISVANNLAYASKFSQGDDPEKDVDYMNYPQPQQGADAKTLIQAVFDVIDLWRKADWSYSQSRRNENGYVDCSSLVARSIRQALNLPSTVFKTNGSDGASYIARWFIEHPNYALQEASANTCLLNGKCFENAYQLRPGDLVFFINRTEKYRFPSCWESNSVFDDGSSWFDNRYWCRDVFGANDGKDDNGVLYYGITHIAIVHDCLIDSENTYDELNGYIYTSDNKRLRTDTDPNAPTFKPEKEQSGLWLLEAVPYRKGKETPEYEGYRRLTTYINGTFKENFNCTPVNVGAGNILYQKKNAKQEVTSSYGEDGTLEELVDVKSYDWTDDTIAFFIRPDYKKIFDDFSLTNNNT